MTAFEKSNAKTSSSLDKLLATFKNDMWLLILTQTEISYDNVKAAMDEVDKNNKELLEFLSKNKKRTRWVGKLE